MFVSIPFLNEKRQVKDKSLNEVFEGLKRDLTDKGIAILDFQLDGTSLTPDMQRKLADEPVDKYEKLEVECRDASELALSVLDEVIKHLPALKELSAKASSLLAKGDKTTGFTEVKNYFELWQVILDSVNKIGILLNVDFKTITTDGINLQDEIMEIVDLIGECKNALIDGDYVALNDIVDYELSEKVTTSEKILKQLKRCIEDSR